MIRAVFYRMYLRVFVCVCETVFTPPCRSPLCTSDPLSRFRGNLANVAFNPYKNLDSPHPPSFVLQLFLSTSFSGLSWLPLTVFFCYSLFLWLFLWNFILLLVGVIYFDGFRYFLIRVERFCFPQLFFPLFFSVLFS